MHQKTNPPLARQPALVVLALLFVLLFAGAFTIGAPASIPAPPTTTHPAGTESNIAVFAAELEQIRQGLKIPGMSAAIVQDQELLWAQGFGYADLEEQLPATAETPYHLASVTKPMAATLLLQLVEEGRLSLDDPVSQYGIHLPESGVTVWHLLTHTSAGIPGNEHDYDGNRYALLARVFARACGAPFGQCFAERIITPLAMDHTAPNPVWGWSGWSGMVASMGWGEQVQNFPRVYRELARPYQFDPAYDNVPGAYPLFFSPAAGLMASVTDVARFDIALDGDQLVRPDTKAAMFTPAVSNDGQPLIYGLGWYTQAYQDTRLIWHSGGWSPSVSALYLKVPDENLTFIVLANNYNLTRPYPLGDGDVLYSTPALAFYRHFVFPRRFGKSMPAIDWSAGAAELVAHLNQIADADVRALLERELWSYRKLYASVGEMDRARRLGEIHRVVFPEFSRSRWDPVATGMTAPPPSPQPVALLPAQVSVLNGLLFGWLALAFLALIVLIVDLWRTPAVSRSEQLAWIPITLLFGPLALVAYLFSGDRQPASRPVTEAGASWRRALRPALFHATGNIAGLFLALWTIYLYFPDIEQGALPAVGAMFLVNWFLFQAPLAARVRDYPYLSALRATFTAALASTLCVLLGTLPAMIYLTEGLLLHVLPDNPLYLLVMFLDALAGAVVVYPYTVWWIHRRRDRALENAVVATAEGGRPL